jgi:integrase
MRPRRKPQHTTPRRNAPAKPKAPKRKAFPAAPERRRRLLAAALKGESGRYWYDHAQQEINTVARAWGVDPVYVAVAVAATSPATKVISSPRMARGGGSSSNIGKARRVVKALAAGESAMAVVNKKSPGATVLKAFESCRIRPNPARPARWATGIERGVPRSGPAPRGGSPWQCLQAAFPHPEDTKTHAFVRNLLGDKEAVTVDTLIGRGAGIPPSGEKGTISVTKARYRLIAEDIRAVARQLGWAPAEVMAAAWTGFGGTGALSLTTSGERVTQGLDAPRPRRTKAERRAAAASRARFGARRKAAAARKALKPKKSPKRRTNGTRAALVKHMCACGYSAEDAERMAPKSEVQTSSRRALTPDELRRFQSAVRSVKDPAIRTILLLLPLTGMRVAEACSMRLSAVTEGGRRGNLRAEVLGKAKGGRPKIGKSGRGPNGERIVFDDKAKTIDGRNIGRMVDWQGRPVKAPPQKRTVPLGSHGTRLVTEYLQHRPAAKLDRVFVGPKGGAITTGMVQAACKAVAKRAGVPGVTPHFLRHTFVSQAIAKCWDPQRVREIIGHGRKDAQGRSLGGRLPAVTLLYIDDKALRNGGK